MKKILALLSTVSLSVLGTYPLISCNVTHINKIDLSSLNSKKDNITNSLKFFLNGSQVIEKDNLTIIQASIMQKLISELGLFSANDIKTSLIINLYNGITKTILNNNTPSDQFPTNDQGIIIEVIANENRNNDISVNGAFKTDNIIWDKTISALDISPMFTWNKDIELLMATNFLLIRTEDNEFKNILTDDLTIDNLSQIMFKTVQKTWIYLNINFSQPTAFDNLQVQLTDPNHNPFSDPVNTKFLSLATDIQQKCWFEYSQSNLTFPFINPNITTFETYQMLVTEIGIA